MAERRRHVPSQQPAAERRAPALPSQLAMPRPLQHAGPSHHGARPAVVVVVLMVVAGPKKAGPADRAWHRFRSRI